MKMKEAILLVLCFISAAVAVCPDNWVSNGNSCYYVSSLHGGKNGNHHSWHEAQSRCEYYGGYLVVIGDKVENDYLYNLIQGEQGNKGGDHWIGLHDLVAENEWQWTDGSAFTDASFKNWGPGQPDNYPGGGAGGEDCVEFIADDNQAGLWNDESCSPRQNYVCERDINAAQSANCLDGWDEFNNRCYRLYDDVLPWVDADQKCKQRSANLVAITSSDEQTYAAAKINNINSNTWIGLSTLNNVDSSNLYWSNQYDTYVEGTSYNNWATNEPNLSATGTNCVNINPGVSTDGPWAVERCGEGHPYMCESVFQGDCADGWRLFNGTCYLIVVAESGWMNWPQAKEYCDITGGSLLTIDSDYEMEYILTRLDEINDAGSVGLWLGVSDSDVDGSFVWVDGVADADKAYRQWGPNQPYNNKNSWDCGQMYTSSTSGNWETEDCFQQQSFICEIQAGIDPVVPENTADNHLGCEPGWVWYKDNCYFFESTTTKTWDQAEEICVQSGGHLASIGDGNENAFVAAHATQISWIGGNDLGHQGTWVWADGTPVTFTNWYPGEPNDSGRTMRLWPDKDYTWDDNPQQYMWSYICEKQSIDCNQALGLEDRTITDDQMTASSVWDEYHAASQGRLNNYHSGPYIGAWLPQDGMQANSWIQVKLVPERRVTAITTQGRPSDYQQYVKTYSLQYSSDGVSWTEIMDEASTTEPTPKLFTANFDTSTPITNYLSTPINTAYIRLYPQDYQEQPALRMEILGCQSDGEDISTTPDQSCTSVTVDDRLDCGYPGISATECKAKGCCWDSSQPAIWCFYHKDDYDARCGDGWVFDPSGTYFCYKFNEQRHRTWTQAYDYCKQEKGDLISIGNQEEQSFLAGQISQMSLTASFWIGANDRDSESGWKWSDGSAFKYFNWVEGEPNNLDTENCVEMYTGDARWNDNQCDKERAVACRKIAKVAPPLPSGQDGNMALNICEGETGILTCQGTDVIVIHHAAYGRSNRQTCSSDQDVPADGCTSEDALTIVSDMCDYNSVCYLPATNEIFGDPCSGVYKYLNVIYSCETIDCYQYMGVSNGSVTDSQISESSSIDNSHKGIHGRLNGAASWASSEPQDAWIQTTFSSKRRISGIVMQGAADADRWVTTYKVQFAVDDTLQSWIDYQSIDGVMVTFDGNSDRNTLVRGVLAEQVYTSAVRIVPLTWYGDVIGMRYELTGCLSENEITCDTTGEDLFSNSDADGTTVVAECPSGCSLGKYKIYGTDIYSAKSQICPAAIHAGATLYSIGGLVTVVKKPSQSQYTGSIRNEITSQDESYYASSFAFAGSKKTCQKGWIGYEDDCYWVSDDVLTWRESDLACKSLGAELVSMQTTVDQDFLEQLLIQNSAYNSSWIGLNDLRVPNQFEWSDGSYVWYTNWQNGEPNNWEGQAENCVEIYVRNQNSGGAGKWNDANCDDLLAYTCKKTKDYYSPDESEDPTLAPDGCDEGWLAFENMCYWLYDADRKKESDAQTYCSDNGAEVVLILDKYTQSFLHTQIGQLDKRWWIGIHAEISDNGDTEWSWQNGDAAEYDNWNYGQPNIGDDKDKLCAVFYGGPYGSGLWTSYNCEDTAFTICQKLRDGYTPRPDPTLPAVGGCPGDWSYVEEGNVYYDEATGGYCYKVFNPTNEGFDLKQSWEDARHQCMSNKGNLVSVHSGIEENYVLSLLVKMGIESQMIWIGLSDKSGWTWSDGTATNYLKWDDGYPVSSQYNPQGCVVMTYETSDGTVSWRNVNCAEKLDWICKREKGIVDTNPTVPPAVVNPACGSENDGTWLYFNEVCYLFYDQVAVDYYNARQTCQSFNGELVSVHSDTEQTFLTNQMQSMTGLDRYWIGLREVGGVGGEYLWTDDTVVDFVYWNTGEPNDVAGLEQCAEATRSTGRWNDANCGLTNAGYICKKYLGAPPAPPTAPVVVSGGCPEGWYSYSGYCYKWHGDSAVCDPETAGSDTNCAASWKDANLLCQKEGANLVTIHDKYENAFIASQSYRVIHNFWIGLSDFQWYKQYTWASGDQVIYVNWNEGEPSHSEGQENCVEMYKGDRLAGRWNDNNCDVVAPYMCSKPQDVNIKPGNEVNKNKKCPDGWMQYDFWNDYGCYYYDTTPRTFDDARSNCKKMNKNADLASFALVEEQMFVNSFVKDGLGWIGLTFDSDSSEWYYVDGWNVYFSSWGYQEPGSDTTTNCALLADGVIGPEWVTASCQQTYPSICKTSTVSVPPTPGYVSGYCPDPNMREFGGFCFFNYQPSGVEGDNGVSWNEAELACNKQGGNLVSYQSGAELDWVLSWFNDTSPVWIGLIDNGNGGWQWTDGKPVNFLWWNTGEPNNYGDGEDCVEQFGEVGRWNDVSCSELRGYICAVPKVIGTDAGGNTIRYTTPPVVSKKTNAGAVIGVILAIILAIIATVLCICVCAKRGNSTANKIKDTAAEFSPGFVNKLYESVTPSSKSTQSDGVSYQADDGATSPSSFA